MNISLKTTPSEGSQRALDALKIAVAHALDKKRRLGQVRSYLEKWQACQG